MKNIKIQVSNKIASLVNNDEFLVCGNSDYTVTFEFDEGWENYVVKTALFVFGNEAVAKVFEGDTCEGVAIEGATKCGIGCFAGDLRTTTPAFVNCLASVRDLGGVPDDPDPEVYDQIMELLNRYINSVKGAPAGGKIGQVLKKKSDLDYDYSWENDEKSDLSELNKKIDGKLDKVTTPAGTSRVYGVNGEGTQKTYPIASSATGGTVAIRDAQGHIGVSAPTADTHAANKQYVDEQIPSFVVTTTENGYEISITQDGNTEKVQVKNGEKGDPYTLTEADRETIVQDVLSALPNGDEVAY